ncbi:DUF4157 domain-containing protein [Pseudorhodoferax sp.]|uniref:eCIS core domain-containing protein n=1 Tax=Pseudorhodoferax sp. TaxID=1993553 RepID=UPI0039E2C6AA
MTCRTAAPRPARPDTGVAGPGLQRNGAGSPPAGLDGLHRSVLQRRLAVGAADDPLEHEADQAAERALQGGARPPAAAWRGRRLAPRTEAAEPLPGSVLATLRTPGMPLDDALRADFGARFGHDFGQVRVHRDAAAARSAQDVAALAYTVGPHIVFGAGRYAPHGGAGRRLLAHELAHVVQQSAAPPVLLQRAEVRQGALRVEVDYSPIIRVTAADRPGRILALMAALAGAPADAVQDSATRALDAGAQEWLLFALQLLQRNRSAASTLNGGLAVQRLLAYAPMAQHRPLPDPDALFVREALRESGWSQTAQAQRLAVPGAADRAAVDAVVNPVPSSGSATDPLDVAEFHRRLPPALTHLLQRLDPARWTHVGTRSLSAFQAIGDIVQAEARSFFAPYADAAIGNLYDLRPAWHASAHIFDVGASTPTADQRIGYLLNRAEIVGRSAAVTPAINDANIFDQTHFDGSRPDDRRELLAVATALAGDATVAAIVDRLLQHTGRKSGTGAATTIGLVTGFDADAADACTDHWRGIQTLCHEVLHALVHPDFNAMAGRVRFPQVIREGFTEVLGVQLFNQRVRPKAASDPAFKSRLEAGVSGAPCPAPAADTIGYGAAGAGAETIRVRVGDSNFRAAYFLGRHELAGMA